MCDIGNNEMLEGIGEKGGGLRVLEGRENCWIWKLMKEKLLTKKVSEIPISKPMPKTRA